MKRVVIIGGGITGLSAAYDLEKAGGFEVTLIEASGRLGGKIGTAREGELLIERGPDAVFTRKPWANDLAADVGLPDDAWVEPLHSEFSILVNGRLQHVPRALASLMPSAASALEGAGFFSSAVKKRILAEREVPAGEGKDESIASFFRRRFGKKFSQLLAEPMLAGIHAGDPETLSMQALYPSYLGLEQKHGSLSNFTPPPPPPGHKPAKVGFMTLKDGMGVLVDKIVEHLQKTRILLNTEAEQIQVTEKGVSLLAGDAGRIEADYLILSLPANIASCVLRKSLPQTSELLQKIHFRSTAVVTLAYPMAAFPKGLYGNGFLVPYTEGSPISGCTWSSSKWPDRAPSDTALLRVFMGRHGGTNVDECRDDELTSLASDALAGILSPKQSHSYARVDRWTKGMPQYEVGHLDLMAEIEKSIGERPIFLAGSSYNGNSVPDCIRQGRETAQRIINS
jgi:oxygen-dependent protoporphyrinogen oxidase